MLRPNQSLQATPWCAQARQCTRLNLHSYWLLSFLHELSYAGRLHTQPALGCRLCFCFIFFISGTDVIAQLERVFGTLPEALSSARGGGTWAGCLASVLALLLSLFPLCSIRTPLLVPPDPSPCISTATVNAASLGYSLFVTARILTPFMTNWVIHHKLGDNLRNMIPRKQSCTHYSKNKTTTNKLRLFLVKNVLH